MSNWRLRGAGTAQLRCRQAADALQREGCSYVMWGQHGFKSGAQVLSASQAQR